MRPQRVSGSFSAIRREGNIKITLRRIDAFLSNNTNTYFTDKEWVDIGKLR